MGRINNSYRICAALTGALLVTACTVHKQAAPSLTGPSELGTAIVLTVSPDVLSQDGSSQSLVQITARDNNGQALRNVSLRAEISVGGAITDFGRLSAKNVVTDASGRAAITYTAPDSVVGNTNEVVVQILVTPAETNFADATARSVTIRLVPTGTVGPPVSPLKPDFVPPAATVGNVAVFSATVTDAAGADATSLVTSYAWDFGDGGTAAGRNATHTYTDPGAFAVSLTITDTLGRSQRTTHSVTLGQGQLPTANIQTPSGAELYTGQTVHFNGSGSTAEPGHRVVDWAWNFGDGDLGSAALATHVYRTNGTYTVTLKVTDDVGRKSLITNQSVTIQTDEPDAIFTVIGTLTVPSGGHTTVTFDASTSKAIPGRTIVSNQWSVVAIGTTASAIRVGESTDGKQTSVVYDLTQGAYTVTLTVTDDAGKKDVFFQNLTVSASTGAVKGF